MKFRNALYCATGLLGYLAVTGVPSSISSVDSRDAEWVQAAASRAGSEVKTLRRHFSDKDGDLDQIRMGLRYIADEIDHGLDSEKGRVNPVEVSKGRIEDVRKSGKVDQRLNSVLDALKGILSQLPRTDYYDKNYEIDFLKQIPQELRWFERQMHRSEEISVLVERHLLLPDDLAKDAGSRAYLPVDLPVDQYERLDPLRKFLMKHRTAYPPSITPVTVEDIIAGKLHVGVGVRVTGTVTRAGYFWGDGDYTFDLGNLHLEITPEWRLKHRNMHLPKRGEKVQIEGWTYYDSFHEDHRRKLVSGPFGSQRIFRDIVWEVHPVQQVRQLK